MSEVDRIIATIRKSMPVIGDKYKVKTTGIFGSYICGEQKKGEVYSFELQNML
jgi:predicted nucleotidyltransferase